LSGEDGTFEIRALAPSDAVHKFEIAHIDDAHRAFLKKLAGKFCDSNISKTYVAVEGTDQGPRIRSYVNILLSEIRKGWAATDDCPEAQRFNYPAVKIGRLATDRRYEGRGLGSSLIEFVAGLAVGKVMPHVGCRFLILDANRPKIEYYERRGFILVKNDENLAATNQNPVMFMDLHKIAMSAPEPQAGVQD
jgi:GNAT superfamily N-acetyltransferase